MTDIAYCQIFPSIGIARVGNSPEEFFLGPELPNVVTNPTGGFKDNGESRLGIPPRIKRQAARFRIFAFDSADRVIGELTSEEAEIEWTVHLVNKKAEADRFAGLTGEELPIGERRPREFWRNTLIEDRNSLIIDPGPRTLYNANQTATFDGGRFRGIDVNLGKIIADGQGRLLVLGGVGRMGSSNPGQPITNYANNDLWFDDTSDGPVTAKVTLKSGKELKVDPAWVIVAPPDFAPSITNIVTLYDVVLDTTLRHNLGSVSDAPGDTPSFKRHIAPIFERLRSTEFVQNKSRAAGDKYEEFEDVKSLELADDAKRERIFALFRNPNLDPESDEAKKQASADFLPVLSGDAGDATPGVPNSWLTLTRTQYIFLENWAKGQFIKDSGDADPKLDNSKDPFLITSAVLNACTGGAFYPGIEGGWLFRNPQAYTQPFRLSHDKFSPGDLTRRMACPWGSDFFECMWHWWPAQRPDEVLSTQTYRRLKDIQVEISRLSGMGQDTESLEAEKQSLLENPISWTRGLPPRSFEGDVAMISNWAQHGFVLSGGQNGDMFFIEGKGQVHVETERGEYDGLNWPEYFHILTNIEQYPSFLPKAKELANWFFSQVNYAADDFYRPFKYSENALDERMKAIYDAYVADINDRSRMDTGIVSWPVVVRKEGDKSITKLVDFDVKPFSNRAVVERLRQRAPFNLVDGAWLQRIQPAGPIDDIRAHLFAIWDDEAGNGKTEQNHCNVYDTLLRSQNVYMPPITSYAFIQQGLLPGSFIQPVFQLVVGLFPEEFFPELLGMTLYLEWEASPTLTPTVRHYAGRGINPHFYSLHVAIDNITAGHGFMAKEAIKLYLQKVQNEGGDNAVNEMWERIWCGYVTWATAGDLGRDLTELCMIIDHKQIDLAYPAIILPSQILAPSILIKTFKAAAIGEEQNALSMFIVNLFSADVRRVLQHFKEKEPSQQLLNSVVDELNKLLHLNLSIYSDERFKDIKLGKDTEELLRSTQVGEGLVKLNRLLLRDGYHGLIDDMPKLEPNLFPNYKDYYEKRFVELIRKKAYAAKPFHRGVVIGGFNLSELFDDPEQMAKVLATSSFIDIEHPRSSRFFDAISFNGPMYKIFTDAERDVILDWIESLRQPVSNEPIPLPNPQESAAKMLMFLKNNSSVGGAVQRHAQYSVQGKPLKEWFSDPLGLMTAFKNSPDWVVPGNSRSSRLFNEFDSGRMRFMGSEVAEMIKRWIDTGAQLPTEDLTSTFDVSFLNVATASGINRFSEAKTNINVVSDPKLVSLPIFTPPSQNRFAVKRKLIGMGSVH